MVPLAQQQKAKERSERSKAKKQEARQQQQQDEPATQDVRQQQQQQQEQQQQQQQQQRGAGKGTRASVVRHAAAPGPLVAESSRRRIGSKRGTLTVDAINAAKHDHLRGTDEDVAERRRRFSVTARPSLRKLLEKLDGVGELHADDIKSEAERIHTEHELEKARLAFALDQSRKKQAASVEKRRRAMRDRRATNLKSSRRVDTLEKTIELSDRATNVT